MQHFYPGRTSLRVLWERADIYQIHPGAIHSKSIRTGNSQFRRRQLWGLAFAFKGARVLVVSSLSIRTQDNIIPGYFVLCGGRTSGVGIKQTALTQATKSAISNIHQQ